MPALRALAALLRAGLPMASAIDAWPDHTADDLRMVLLEPRARVALGDSPAAALSAATAVFGDDASAVGEIAELHDVTGCDAASLLEETAARIERRAALAKAAASATAGAKLSGWMLAGLPLAAAPLVPALGSTPFDRRGSLLLVCGATLLLAGISWIRRLLPRPPGRDEVGELADLLAAALGAGADLGSGLAFCFATVTGPVRTELYDSARRVGLGATWGSSLAASSDGGLRRVADVILRSERLGASAAGPLKALARARRSEVEASFDRSVRRAPVLMVLPLTTCILPAYVLLAIGPILRGVSIGS